VPVRPDRQLPPTSGPRTQQAGRDGAGNLHHTPFAVPVASFGATGRGSRIASMDQRQADADHLRRHLRRAAIQPAPRTADLAHSSLDPAILPWLKTWPTQEETPDLVPEYRALSNDAQWPFAFAAYCLIEELESGRPVLNPPRRIDKELVSRDLAFLSRNKDGEDTVVLTDLGKSLARFAISAPPRPPYLRSLHVPYRATLRSLISVMCPPPSHVSIHSFVSEMSSRRRHTTTRGARSRRPVNPRETT